MATRKRLDKKVTEPYHRWPKKLLNKLRYCRFYERGTPKKRKRLQHEKNYIVHPYYGVVTSREASYFRALVDMNLVRTKVA